MNREIQETSKSKNAQNRIIVNRIIYTLLNELVEFK